VAQSQYDALSTYLVWLRAARFAGFFSEQQYIEEQERVRRMVGDRIAQGDTHLTQYLERWNSFQPQTTAVISLATTTEGTEKAA
jgi:hypothetical protein